MNLPDPSWIYPVGVIAILLPTLAGGALLLLRFVREVRGEVEPRANPPIHSQIETRVGSAERSLKAEIAAEKAAREYADHQLHGRISGLRDEIRKDLERSTEKMEDAAHRMEDTYAQTVEKIGTLRGEMAGVQRAAAQNSDMIQRHLSQHHNHHE